MIEPLDRDTVEILDAMGFVLAFDQHGDVLTVTNGTFSETWIAADGMTEQQLAGQECMTFAGRLYLRAEGARS